MGLLTSDEQGSLSSLNHSIYSEAQRPARSLALTGAYAARWSQDSSPESRAGGLESRRLCGPGGYHPWSRPEIHRAEHLQVWRRRSDTDSEAKTLAQVKLRSRSRRAAASTTTS